MAKWCDVLPMVADDRRNVVLQQEGRLPAVACAYGAKWWRELVDAIPRFFLGYRDDILRLFPATNQRKPGVIHWGVKRGDCVWCSRYMT